LYLSNWHTAWSDEEQSQSFYQKQQAKFKWWSKLMATPEQQIFEVLKAVLLMTQVL